MKFQVLRSTDLARAGRLDTEYFLAPPDGADQRVKRLRASGVRFVPMAGSTLGARIWGPKRFKRAYAASAEERIPYLRPHDVFNYLPTPADWLSVSRTVSLEQYKLRQGMILQTCSGRNLGPAVMVDECLSRFVLSHDMLRIEIPDERFRFYVLAYLKSATGQELLRKDRTGSVIDHLTAEHVSLQQVPLAAESFVDDVAQKMKCAFEMREQARQELTLHIERFQAELPPLHRTKRTAEGWTVRASKIGGRLDAAFYDPLVALAKRQVQKSSGIRVRDVARVQMLGRYKRLYTDKDNGRPIVSGAQLLQSQPVHVQHISPESFDDVSAFELRPGWIAYPSDGRAEESLGTPVVITHDKSGWLASNMIARVIPNEDVDVGWLFLAMRSQHAQVQFKATSSGSVVDHTYPDDMNEVLLPQVKCNGQAVMRAWHALGSAQILENEVIASLDRELETGSSQLRPSVL